MSPRPRHAPSPEMRAWDALRRPIWLFDPRGLRGVYANPAALALWGAESLDELLARDFSQLSPAVRARVDRLARDTAGGAVLNEQWTFYPQGRPAAVQAAISTYRLDDGSPVLLFEAAPAEVEAEERRAVEALRHTSALITLFDAEGRALFANPAAFAAYGAADHPFERRFFDPELARDLLARALAGRAAAELTEAVTAAGLRWHHMDARPVTDPATGLVGVLLNERDVTDRIEAERAQGQAERKAAMADARQKFLSDMSHELRTPLNAVLGFSELLTAAELAPAAADQARRIHQAGERLLTVVNGMIALVEDESWTGAAPGAAEPSADETGAGPRILYVDDHEANRALIRAMLESLGLACVTANDGAEGVKRATAEPFDLILMDIQMPVMDGVEATRRIRRAGGRAPILALTANTLTEQIEGYRDAGMDDCLAKPVALASLVGALQVWLGRMRTSENRETRAA